MAPKSSTRGTKKAANLAQPTLSFQTRKPGPGGKKAALSRTPSVTSLRQTESETSVHSAPGADEKSKRLGNKSKLDPIDVSQTSLSEAKLKKGEKRQLNVNAKEWDAIRKSYKASLGGIPPIHAGPDTHNDIHHILRTFDMTSKYGPSVGITRLQRWERAKKWGLSPPDEIRDILTTQQGEDEPVYRENVLYTWLG